MMVMLLQIQALPRPRRPLPTSNRIVLRREITFQTLNQSAKMGFKRVTNSLPNLEELPAMVVNRVAAVSSLMRKAWSRAHLIRVRGQAQPHRTSTVCLAPILSSSRNRVDQWVLSTKYTQPSHRALEIQSRGLDNSALKEASVEVLLPKNARLEAVKALWPRLISAQVVFKDASNQLLREVAAWQTSRLHLTGSQFVRTPQDRTTSCSTDSTKRPHEFKNLKLQGAVAACSAPTI